MTKLLADLLREDYLAIIKARMMEKHHNHTSLARSTGYSNAHIGNVFRGRGSDEAIAAICKILGIDIRNELFKDEYQDGGNKTGTEG